MHDRVGEILNDKYRLLRLLGSGGMGSVYEGEHLAIGKHVAVKFMHLQFARNAEAVRRFQQEARAAAAAGHPGIVDIYDIGQASDGAPYLVMELLAGESLGALLQREKTLPVPLAVAIARGALSALGAAHDKGVVHRDIKPDNIFLESTSSEGPSVKLLDFGVSKMSQLGVPAATQEGVALGTPHYMAPEQARGELTLDARVDVYAMGVILYEALTGRLPFDAPNYNALLMRLISDTPPAPRTLRPDLPAELEQVIVKAMARSPADRYPSAEALAEALRPFRDLDSQSAPVASPAGSGARSAGAPDTLAPKSWVRDTPLQLEGASRARWVALGLVGVAVAGGAAYWASARSSDVVEARWSAPPAVGATVGVPAPPPPPALAGPGAARMPAAPPVAAPASPAAPGSVTVALTGVPAGARVFLDDARVPQLPIRIPRGDVMVRLRVEADGFSPMARMVVPDRDQSVEVSLTPAPRGGGSKRRGIFRDTSEFDQ